MKLQERYNVAIQRKKVTTSMLVSGYHPAPLDIQTACMSQPKASYGGTMQITLTIPESDKALLETLAGRLGWLCS